MKLDRYIRKTTVYAALVWSAAGAVEFVAGDHGWAVFYAGFAALALVIDAAWRVITGSARSPR